MAQTREVLKALHASQSSYEPSIIKLGEPLSAPLAQNTGERISDVSVDVLKSPTPASLEADLTHYKELFSKLRFSYLEQVTKEKFIRAIVGDPPLVVDHQENVELEAALAGSKAALKDQKTEVAELVAELGQRGRELCRKYQNNQFEIALLERLPEKIEGLQESIQHLSAGQESNANPNLSLPLEKTFELISERERERAELDRQLEQMQGTLQRKNRELERLNAELQPLEVRRLGTTASAREAKMRKDGALGGVEDDLEERGRWWGAVEKALSVILVE